MPENQDVRTGPQHLWNAESEFPLDTAGYEIVPEPEQRASLSGPQPVYGRGKSKGIGGTDVSAEPTNYHPPNPHDAVRHERAPTPEELMAMADAMEREQLAQHSQRMGQGPAVDPIQDRQLGRANSAPDWLNQYMDAQQLSELSGLSAEPENSYAQAEGVYTGPTGPAMGMSFDGIDKVGGRKYRSEQERLKELRNEERHAGRR